MKVMFVAAAVAAFLAGPLTAGGYVAPVTEVAPVASVAPAQAFTWSGSYVGLTAGQQRFDRTTTTTTEVDCPVVLQVAEDEDNTAPICTETATATQKVREGTYGGFIGHRVQWQNNFVTGGEVQYVNVNDDDTFRVMGQLGYALNRTLPYLTVGYDLSNDEPVYGAGIDVAITNHVIGGVAYTQSDNADLFEARLGFKF